MLNIWDQWHHVLSPKCTLNTCSCTIMFPLPMSTLEEVLSVLDIKRNIQSKQPIKRLCWFKLINTTIKPYLMSAKLNISSDQWIKECLKAILKKMGVILCIIANIKMCLLNHYTMIRSATNTINLLHCMPIYNMDKYEHSVQKIILVLYLRLCSQSIILREINHWDWYTYRKCVKGTSKLMILLWPKSQLKIFKRLSLKGGGNVLKKEQQTHMELKWDSLSKREDLCTNMNIFRVWF